MRVLHFYKTYITDTQGGVEQFIFQLINGLVEYGVESEVLSLSKNKETSLIQLVNHKVHRAPLDLQIASTGFSLSAIREFKKLARDVDIIHYHFPWPFMDLVHFINAVKKPTLVTYHSDIVRQKYLVKLYKPLMHLFLNQVDRIVCTSPNYKQTSKTLAKYTTKTTVIPIGLEEKLYTLCPEAVSKWRNLTGGRFFLFIGMLRYYKGLHFLLQAMSPLDYPLLIVGEGPEEKALKALAKDLGLKNIQFLGAVDDVDKNALLHLAYAFVFPSHLRSEAFGISLLEAAMFSKPLISCEIGTGTTYINKQGETGIVIPAENPELLRKALTTLWENPAQAMEYGKNARLRFERLFTAKKMSMDYWATYKSLCPKLSSSQEILTN